jgi:hypothetical protein
LSLTIGDVIHYTLRVVRTKGLDHFRADPARAASDEDYFASEIERVSHLPI